MAVLSCGLVWSGLICRSIYIFSPCRELSRSIGCVVVHWLITVSLRLPDSRFTSADSIASCPLSKFCPPLRCPPLRGPENVKVCLDCQSLPKLCSPSLGTLAGAGPLPFQLQSRFAD